MVLEYLQSWAPFKIDALGLVTILGADEADRAVGRLARSWLTDSLPLLGAYTVASNHITEAIPGFTLYNVTDGIQTTDISGWFARWIMCQDLAYSASTIRITVRQNDKRRQRRDTTSQLCALAIGFIALGPIFAMAILIQDWWGLANTISTIVSVLVRHVVVAANTHALDRAAISPSLKFNDEVKIFLTTPAGQGVTICVPRVVVINCLLTTPRPARPAVYRAARTLGWLAFGIHVIALGMSCLFIQILSTAVILAATVSAVRMVGSREGQIGSCMFLEQIDYDREYDSRTAAYARMRLSDKEMASMQQWNLVPHTSNKEWWSKYENMTKKKQRPISSKS